MYDDICCIIIIIIIIIIIFSTVCYAFASDYIARISRSAIERLWNKKKIEKGA